MHDIAEFFKLPKAQTQEYMVEFADIGKISIEEAVVKAIAGAEHVAYYQEVIKQTGSNL